MLLEKVYLYYKKLLKTQANNIEREKIMNTDIIRGFIISTITVACFIGFSIFLKSNSPKEVAIPNVVGLTVEEAENKIKNAGLNFEIDKEISDETKPNNVVTSQDPKYMGTNYTVKKGSFVKVIINKKWKEQ